METHRESLDDLVAACLERMETDGVDALEEMCSEHEEHADALRRRVEQLQRTGMFEMRRPDDFGPYHIVCPLGAGGMGEVFLARQEQPIRREVALKVIRPSGATSEVVARFEAERQALAALNHDGVAKVYDAGATPDGRPFFAMERVDGTPITEFCATHRLSLAERIDLVARVADAVQHAHQRGILHRDLKPSNLLVAGDREQSFPKVIDFGLAKAVGVELTEQSLHTEAGQLLGTPEYMSSEQTGFESDAVDSRTDVYSLGVVLFELVTGCLPFDFAALRRDGIFEMLKVLRDDERPLPSARFAQRVAELDEFVAGLGAASTGAHQRALQGELDWILGRALEREPGRRYASMSEFAADLRRYLQKLPVEAGPRSLGYQARCFARRHRVGVASAVSILIVAGVLGAMLVGAWRDSSRNLDGFDGLAVDRELTELLDEERREAWGPRKAALGRMDAWSAAVQKIADRESELRLLAEEIRTREGAPGPEGATIYADPKFAILDATFERIWDRLDRVGVVAPSMVRRSAWARVMLRAVDEPGTAWGELATRLAANDRYRVTVDPQVGLVPVGPDPETGLEEFALALPGCEIPARDADGRLVLGVESAPVLVLIPGAKFRGRVPLEPYFLGKHELSIAQWGAMGEADPRPEIVEDRDVDPADLGVDTSHPVTYVTWSRAHYVLRTWGCRLPTEIQWVHGYLGGADEAAPLQGAANLADASHERELLAFDQSARALVSWDDGHAMTAPIHAFEPNGFGLHNMAGNVFELCIDPYGTVELRHFDGMFLGKSNGERRMRGGSWMSGPRLTQIDQNKIAPEDMAGPTIGVRLSRPLDVNVERLVIPAED